MRVVVDTNVWVSAFLTPAGIPAGLLRFAQSGGLQLIYSAAIETEYRDVLARPKFKFSRVFQAEFFVWLRQTGLCITPTVAVPANLPDPEDAPFIVAALTANCPVVTGNIKHYPKSCGVFALSPQQLFTRLESRNIERRSDVK